MVADVVESTQTAARVGDQGWRQLLLTFRRAVRFSLARFGGTEIDTAGDGLLATFVLPSAALRCGKEIAAEAGRLGIVTRVGLHAGEILLEPPGVVGIAVHIAARVAPIANPGEVLFTETVRSLTMGTGVAYEPAGEHTLKGVPGTWPLYRLTD